MFNKKKDTFSRENFPKRFQTYNVSIHTKEFFTGTDPDYQPIIEAKRPEILIEPNFNPQNFNSANFRGYE